MLRRLSVVLGGALWFCLAGGTCEAANTPTAMPSSLTQVTTPEENTAEPKSSKETETLLRAIEESRAALAANPDNAELRFRLAFALESHGDIDDAIKEYQAVIVRDPSYVWAHNNLGVLCAQKDLYEEAIGKFGEALIRDPQHETARSGLACPLIVFEKGSSILFSKKFLQVAGPVVGHRLGLAEGGHDEHFR